jgi:hypothetical protein
LESTAHRRLFLSLVAALAAAGCVAALGPGYTIETQEISVQFTPDPQPVIRVDASYRLRNDGNRPLSSLELRLPGHRRFHFVNPRAEWDKHSLSFEPSRANPRDVLLTLPQPWRVSQAHNLHLSVEYQRPGSDENDLSFAPDGFFLPAQGWSPELLPSRGLFATGGVPPKIWYLAIQVPDGFLVHASGHMKKHDLKNSSRAKTQILRFLQDPKDGYPFVIAGRFAATTLNTGRETINLWTRSPQNAEALRQPGEALARAIRLYDSMFGNRLAESADLWIVECPVVTGCFTSSASVYSELAPLENERVSAEMSSADTVMVDLAGGTPQIAAAAPALAATWLGYGQSPGFFEQAPPLSALPAFAAFRGREVALGGNARDETIRRLLRAIPASQSTQPEPDTVLRAKSLLFFYALQDRYGQETFNTAIGHMLEVRRGRGFNVSDLISAFEQEAHENVAGFVRLWMKRPGVPAGFRAHYENSSAACTATSKETSP